MFYLHLPQHCITGMTHQLEFSLSAHSRGFHLITHEVVRQLGPLPNTGILHLFIKHTSAGLSINENADPSVRVDFESIFNRHVPENEPYLTHTIEGPDDMPAHIKTALTASTLNIPCTNGQLALGTWQGVYIWEHRRHGGNRRIVVHVGE